MRRPIFFKSRGFGLLEVVVGSAIVSLSLVGIINVFGIFLRLSSENLRQTQTAFLLEEGAEVARIFRDRGWANISGLTPGSDYFLTFAGSNWATTTSPFLIDSLFERKLKTATVYRDVNNDIAPSGSADPNTRLVTVMVSWRNQGGTTTRAISFYLTNLFAT